MSVEFYRHDARASIITSTVNYLQTLMAIPNAMSTFSTNLVLQATKSWVRSTMPSVKFENGARGRLDGQRRPCQVGHPRSRSLRLTPQYRQAQLGWIYNQGATPASHKCMRERVHEFNVVVTAGPYLSSPIYQACFAARPTAHKNEHSRDLAQL
jgi:hypothetical protein